MHHTGLLVLISTLLSQVQCVLALDPRLFKVWGPGLRPDLIVMPARYFFIEANASVRDEAPFDVSIGGVTAAAGGKSRPCRIWTNILNRNDGSFIVRYKVYDTCESVTIGVKLRKEHVAESPYLVGGPVQADACDCPNGNLEALLERWECGGLPRQIEEDLEPFRSVAWDYVRPQLIEAYDQPHSVSLCHYVIIDNAIHRKCYGKYVGFKMFMDAILLSLARKAVLPDLEFFVNLGDWPLVKGTGEKFPIFSWCGATDSGDIVMPTYDITESTLENMGRVMLDMLSVQGNAKHKWQDRIAKGFWRGRDSSQHRLDLVDISREHPELFNVSLTNFFFFRDKEEQYGPKTEHVSFYSFFDYKYQISLDGTVAAYRFPYLLAGGSLVFKQESKYHEHFYGSLVPEKHYVPIKRDLSDLVEKLRWAIDNDAEAEGIARNAATFANENLLPKDIFCYYAHLLDAFSRRIVSEVVIQPGMEHVPQANSSGTCRCSHPAKHLADEL